MKLNRSFEDADPDTLLREYLSDTETDLDAEDIADLMEDYTYDEDVMSDKEVRKIKRAKKRAVAKAKEYFAEQSKMYAEPKVKVDTYEYESLAECIKSDQVPANHIAEFFSDKNFYKYYKEKYL